MGFRFGFSLQRSCVLHFILLEFLTKGVLEYIFNSILQPHSYEPCPQDNNNQANKLIISTSHKMKFCKFGTDLGDIIYDL